MTPAQLFELSFLQGLEPEWEPIESNVLKTIKFLDIKCSRVYFNRIFGGLGLRKELQNIL